MIPRTAVNYAERGVQVVCLWVPDEYEDISKGHELSPPSAVLRRRTASKRTGPGNIVRLLTTIGWTKQNWYSTLVFLVGVDLGVDGIGHLCKTPNPKKPETGVKPQFHPGGVCDPYGG
jgi:hypothetical protein